ncbi:MAG TPA: hypothetical protein VH092_15245 [Urbifossiella sp.]|jgi:hypothetical protein|nr:hypothetical protein [Urbifossiella sp.]
MRWGSLWVAAAVAFAAGCGSAKTYSVKGMVTFEGKPLKGGGAITFMPTGSQPGRTAGGKINADGTYELQTDKPGDGALAGEFRVIIHQSADREPEPSKDGERAGRAVPAVAEAERIPLIYTDPTNSPLTVKVEAKDNTINLDLKRDAGPPAVKGAMRDAPARDAFAGPVRFSPRTN